jgi:dihydroneopterin aldolase
MGIWYVMGGVIIVSFSIPRRKIMDIVFIEDLQVDTTIGIYDWERGIKQTLAFDIEMATDIRKAAKSDDIKHALNYKAVAKRVIQFVEDSEYLLVERVAEEIADIILRRDCRYYSQGIQRAVVEIDST